MSKDEKRFVAGIVLQEVFEFKTGIFPVLYLQYVARGNFTGIPVF
jgi:hypothetical protein